MVRHVYRWFVVGCVGVWGTVVGAPVAGAQGMAAGEARVVREEVRAFLDEYRARAGAFDVAGLSDLYSQSADFAWIEPGRRSYESAADVTAALASLAGRYNRIVLEVSDVRIVPVCRDAATVSFGFRQRITGPAADPFTLTGVILATVVREGDVWRFLVGQSVATVDGAGR